MKIQAVIVEDEPLAGRALRVLLEATGRVEVVAIARDTTLGFQACAEEAADAAFVDIRLAGGDGIKLAADLARLPKPPLIVFTTGDAGRAPEAFRLHAVDYLLKPIDPAQLLEAVDRVANRLAGRCVPVEPESRPDDSPLGLREGRLPVKGVQDDVIRLIARHEIVAALHHHRRTWIHTAHEEFPTYYPLADLLSWLEAPLFLDISRSAIINLQAVEKVVHFGDRLYRVQLRDRQKTHVQASRSGAQRLASVLKSPC